jgi:DNA invertase Pin-like site-specific DNA recombinase
MDRDDTEKGVGRQREDAEALAASRGYQIEDRYRFTDNDVSASNGDYRPGYAALMDAAARGELDVIIVWQLSRLWRNRRERAGGIDMLKRAGVPVAACKGMDLDLSTSYGRMMGDIMGAADTWESEVKGERVTAAQIQAAAAGRWTGGTRPFGWDLLTDPAAKGTKTEHRLVVPVLNEAEAAEVRRLATALLSGRSLGMLVKDLNDRGIRTTWGGRWTPASLRKVLTRSRWSSPVWCTPVCGPPSTARMSTARWWPCCPTPSAGPAPATSPGTCCPASPPAASAANV